MVTVVTIGKAGFVGTVLVQSKSISRGYVLTMVFDTACVLAYVAFLLGF